MNPKPIFSNDFEKNYYFMYCIKNWNNYLRYVEINSDPESLALAFEWRETIMDDWYRYSKEWLYNNRAGNVFWKRGLE